MARSLAVLVVACLVALASALAAPAAAQAQDALQAAPAVQLAAAFANTEGARFPKGRMVDVIMGFHNLNAQPRAWAPPPPRPCECSAADAPARPPAVVISAMAGELRSAADYNVVERNVRTRAAPRRRQSRHRAVASLSLSIRFRFAYYHSNRAASLRQRPSFRPQRARPAGCS